MKRRFWAHVARGLCIALAAVVVLMASAWLHLREPVGREAFADLISAYVSSQIPGQLALEDVTRVDLPNVHAGRLLLRTAEGHNVLDLHDVEVELDPLATLWHAGPIIHRAHVGSGTIELVVSPNGRTWIERALSSSEQLHSTPHWYDYIGAPGQLTLSLEHVRFERLQVEMALGGPHLSVTGGRGHARIWLPDRGQVEMRYSGVSGVLHTLDDVLPDARFDALTLIVDPQAVVVAQLTAELDALGSHMTLAAAIPMRPHASAHICVWTGGPSIGSAFTHFAGAFASLTSSLGVTVRDAPAPSPPACAMLRHS